MHSYRNSIWYELQQASEEEAAAGQSDSGEAHNPREHDSVAADQSHDGSCESAPVQSESLPLCAPGGNRAPTEQQAVALSSIQLLQ